MNRAELPPGMGDWALCLPLSQIRRLSELPGEVQVVSTLPDHRDVEERLQNEWSMPPSLGYPLYLHIRHRYFPRMPPKAILECITLDDVLERFKVFEGQ
jgi:hypothetical protein